MHRQSNIEQPWMFLYTTRESKELFDTYLGFMSDSDKVWARNAYAIIIPLIRTNHLANDISNRLAYYDTGMAVGNLLVQATALDVIVHQVRGFSAERVREYLKMNDDIEPVTIMVVGYMGDGNSLPPELLQADETKMELKPVNEYSFKDYLYNSAF